ncbi:MAG: GNAT family N-acetyltransferase [Actinomycetota bacterium]
MSEPSIAVRRLRAADLDAFQATMPSWNAREYGVRLAYQGRGLAVQLVAWSGSTAVGRAMVVFPGHPEWSISAFREGCSELRDVGVAEDWQRRGIGSLLLSSSEAATRDAGFERIGLGVGLEDGYEAARVLYDRRGYGFAHGPYVQAARLEGDDGTPFAVAGVCEYRVKRL